MMMCSSPFVQRDSKGGAFVHGCGQCLPCKINVRRSWTARIVLESYAHNENSWLTLTYDDMYLPKGGSLSKQDAARFIDRTRKYFETAFGRRVRYYLVGEYGERTARPHYHICMFGVGRQYQKTYQDRWRFGHIHVDDLNRKTAQYTAGYVVKKMTSEDDPRLNGRVPEFSLKSNGIGKTGVKIIAEHLLNKVNNKVDIFGEDGSLPRVIRIDGKVMPLGRYCHAKLHEYLGLDEAFLVNISRENSLKKREEIENKLRKEFANKRKRKMHEIIAEETFNKRARIELLHNSSRMRKL